jgi:ribonuclease P protein component
VVADPNHREKTGRFTAADRLRRPSEFAAVYALRCSAAAGPIVVYACPRPTGSPRLGLSVSRRVGTAVVRGHWKRRLREAFRRVRARLPTAIDIVIVVRGSGPPHVGAAAAATVENTIVHLVGLLIRQDRYRRASVASSPEPSE